MNVPGTTRGWVRSPERVTRATSGGRHGLWLQEREGERRKAHEKPQPCPPPPQGARRERKSSFSGRWLRPPWGHRGGRGDTGLASRKGSNVR